VFKEKEKKEEKKKNAASGGLTGVRVTMMDNSWRNICSIFFKQTAMLLPWNSSKHEGLLDTRAHSS
jgi:hypothetical protein